MQQITVIYKAYHYFKLLARLNTIKGFTSLVPCIVMLQIEVQLRQHILLMWGLDE